MAKLFTTLIILTCAACAYAENTAKPRVDKQSPGAPPASVTAPLAVPPAYKQNCVACHARMTGGDGTVLYQRDDRIVQNRAALTAQVDYCQSSLELNWSRKTVIEVGNYLNRQFYRFHKGTTGRTHPPE